MSTNPYESPVSPGEPPAPGNGTLTRSLLKWLAVAAVILLGIALLLPTVRVSREPARRSQCTNNLKQIGLALHNYHDEYQCLPPAYLANAEGMPMHSWRVLILPYVEGMDVYQQYNFDEPWNGPHNSRLAASMPSVFACPADRSPAPAHTHYLLITGPKTIGDGSNPTTFSDVTDGLSNTLAMVEATKSVHWMEPADLDYAQMTLVINDAAGNDIGSHHPGGANVLLMDGAVRFLRETMDSEVLRNLILRDDGNLIDPTGL